MSHEAILTWGAPATGDPPASYNVKRGPQPGSEQTIASVPAAASGPQTFTDTGVVGGQTYSYVVTAVDADGESTPSNEVTATVPLAVPQAPQSLSVSVS